MEESLLSRRLQFCLGWIVLLISFTDYIVKISTAARVHEKGSKLGLQLHYTPDHVVMDNGILQVTLSVPGGIVSGIRYKGLDNLLEILNEEENRGYWDTVWNEPGRDIIFDRMEGSAFKVIMNNTKQIELSFTRAWNYSLKGRVIPLNIDTRFIMLHDSPGFYCYGIYEHLQGWPDFNINETRMAFKLRQDKY